MNWMRLFGLLLSLGAVSVAQEQLSFMGYRVVIEEKPRADDFFPEAPASLCLVSETGKQCYEAPKDFGRNANAEVIRLDKDSSALLFSVASGGVSGFEIHYVLLRPGQRLENLFGMGIKVTNQS